MDLTPSLRMTVYVVETNDEEPQADLHLLEEKREAAAMRLTLYKIS